MAKAKKKTAGLSVLAHPLVILVSLVAAEALGMLLVSPLVRLDPGWIVLAGLGVLPLWATFLALVYTANRRDRALGILAAVSVLCIAVLLLF